MMSQIQLLIFFSANRGGGFTIILFNIRFKCLFNWPLRFRRVKRSYFIRFIPQNNDLQSRSCLKKDVIPWIRRRSQRRIEMQISFHLQTAHFPVDRGKRVSTTQKRLQNRIPPIDSGLPLLMCPICHRRWQPIEDYDNRIKLISWRRYRKRMTNGHNKKRLISYFNLTTDCVVPIQHIVSRANILLLQVTKHREILSNK